MLDWINSRWFSVNRLSLNVTKINYMFLGNRKLYVYISVKINKETINRVNVTKFLGVMTDDKLKWKNHICLVKSKLSKSCAIMYRANFLIDRRGMHILYYSLFLLYIMYCGEVWGQHKCNKCSMFCYITENGYKVTLWCQETGPYKYAIL